MEETLNALLDAEADAMCNAQRYERSPTASIPALGTIGASYTPKPARLKMPKLRKQTVEPAVILRYRRREISIEEAISQMYLAGVSVRRVEDIAESLWGTRVSSTTVYKHIERWRTTDLEGEYAYVYLDGIVLKRSWGGEVKNVSVLAAIGVDEDGFRRVLGVAEGHKEHNSGWLGFLKHLKDRGRAYAYLSLTPVWV